MFNWELILTLIKKPSVILGITGGFFVLGLLFYSIRSCHYHHELKKFTKQIEKKKESIKKEDDREVDLNIDHRKAQRERNKEVKNEKSHKTEQQKKEKRKEILKREAKILRDLLQ